ncbi:hypothetical protein BH10ACI3_BH10ACI3_24020 [soil metagenome]
MRMKRSQSILFRRPFVTRWAAIFAILIFGWSFTVAISAQSTESADTISHFRVGERLTYNISFGKFPNAGFAETYVVSNGTLSGKPAVEIHSKVKTVDLISAAFLMFDESRVVFASPATGFPLYYSQDSHEGAIPMELVTSYLSQPTSSYDMLTVLFKARESGGNGTFTFVEKQQEYTVTFTQKGKERINTDTRVFETTYSTVESEYLNQKGVKDLRVYFSTDDAHIPIEVRMKTLKGEFRATIASIVIVPGAGPAVAPTPKPSATPLGQAKVKPTPTPVQYVDNMPLAPELGFKLGELLTYQITTGGKPVATFELNARERKQLIKKEGNEDSLLLTGTVTGVEPGTRDFVLSDTARAQVDPETLAPRSITSKFSSVFPGLNQNATFDAISRNISYGGDKPVDAPIGTQSILSLVYAMRSFNLDPSKDPSNPVNDTRVAVFWENKPYIFTLRPSEPADLVIGGVKYSAQQITVNTGNAALDALGLKVWIGTDDRVPLRFVFGAYQADLVAHSSNLTR